MQDDAFEWDDGKARSNLDKHKVSFELARLAFDDPDCIERDDPDPNEERTTRICRLGERIFVIVWIERADGVRIISARLANKHEQRTYFERQR